jgi:multiple sugar transport system substrate-binding protein
MIAEYAAAGIVAPLDPYLYDPEVGLTADDLADIPSGFLETGRFPAFGQQILAFPFVQNAIGMWVNETVLTQAGWDHVPATWGEFEQACFDVITLTGVRCYPFIESVSTFNAWLYSRGGRQLDEAGQTARFNGPEGVESMALLRRLMEVGLAWRPQDQYGDYTTFANGEAAFTFASTGNSLLYADAYAAAIRGETPPFQWHQSLIPQTDPAVPATALYGTDFFIVRSDPERERAAWRFIHWFTGQAQTARWSADLQAMPVRLSALEVMTDTLETYPFFREQVEEILPFAQPEPSVAAELEIREILYTAILSITQEYADPQTALNQAAAEVNAVLSERP